MVKTLYSILHTSAPRSRPPANWPLPRRSRSTRPTWPNTARCGRNTTARGRSNRARAERTRNRKRRGAGSFPGPVFARCLSPAPAAIQTRMRQRFPAFAGNRNGAVRFAAMRERRRDWMAARLLRTSFCRSARQMRAKERATRRKRKIKGRGRKYSAATAFALSFRSLMPPASAPGRSA